MRICYNELSNYNAGHLVFKWFDLEGLTMPEHHAELQEWLESLPKNDDYPCEEWNVADVEDIPRCFVSDYGLSAEFWEVLEWLNDNDHVEFGAVIGYIDNCGSWDAENFEDSYCGWIDAPFGDAMREYAEEQFTEYNSIPPEIESYIDWDRVARDFEVDHWEHEGHIYRSC